MVLFHGRRSYGTGGFSAGPSRAGPGNIDRADYCRSPVIHSLTVRETES